jgi:hypothetical protein
VEVMIVSGVSPPCRAPNALHSRCRLILEEENQVTASYYQTGELRDINTCRLEVW